MSAGDANALASAINQLLVDPTRRRQLETLGRERAYRVLSWGKVADEYIALYRSLIAEHNNNGLDISNSNTSKKRLEAV